jgi:Uma2 family endonuclease
MRVVESRSTRRFSVQEYERLIAAGVLREGERVELLEGEIITMAAMGLPHARSMVKISYMLNRQIPETCIVGVQIPILLDDESQPEPDLVVYQDREWTTHPTPDGILFVIEVADSSLVYDRDRKFPRYAAAGIPEAWLFDVFGAILERHSEPFEGRYRRVETARRGESLASTVLHGLTLAVDDILSGGR